MEIKLTNIDELPLIWAIKNRCVNKLQQHNITTWDDSYPSYSVFENDQKSGCLYSIFANKILVGSVSVNREMSEEYSAINWEDNNFFVIHRLMIDSQQQGNGYAKEAMLLIEKIIKEKGKSSIRLAVYDLNLSADLLYRKLGYNLKGKVELKNGLSNMYEKNIT